MSLDENMGKAIKVACSVREYVPKSANDQYTGSPILASGASVNAGSQATLQAQRARLNVPPPTTQTGG